MALLTIAIAMIGYGVARGSRYYIKCQREALLDPPVDLLQGYKWYFAFICCSALLLDWWVSNIPYIKNLLKYNMQIFS